MDDKTFENYKKKMLDAVKNSFMAKAIATLHNCFSPPESSS